MESAVGCTTYTVTPSGQVSLSHTQVCKQRALRCVTLRKVTALKCYGVISADVTTAIAAATWEHADRFLLTHKVNPQFSRWIRHFETRTLARATTSFWHDVIVGHVTLHPGFFYDESARIHPWILSDPAASPVDSNSHTSAALGWHCLHIMWPVSPNVLTVSPCF